MASDGFVVISMALLLFLVTTTTTCHARLLKVFIDNDPVEVRESIPDLNLSLSTQLLKIADTKEQVLMVSGVEGETKNNYKNLRALVLASLPKSSKK